MRLKFPFKGNFPITLKFGEIPNDPKLKEKYLEWGIKGHNGVDFGLKEGTKVLAVASGKVILAGESGDFGLCVILEHKWGSSLYAHLSKMNYSTAKLTEYPSESSSDARIKVKLNKKVKRGQILGLSGKSGFVTGSHLHFGIKPKNPDLENGYLGFIDPEPFLKSS